MRRVTLPHTAMAPIVRHRSLALFKPCHINIYPLALNARTYEHSAKYSNEDKEDEEYEPEEEKEYKKEPKKHEHEPKKSKEYKHEPKQYKEHKKYESSKSLPRTTSCLISALLIWSRGEET